MLVISPSLVTILNDFNNRKYILLQIVRQIEKDFDLNNQLKINYEDENIYDQLTTQLKPIVHDLLNSGNGKLEQLLYKIDVDENKVKRTFKQEVTAEPEEIFTHLIVERELQKVLFRELYRKESEK